MTKTIHELIEAAADLNSELWDYNVTAAEIREAVARSLPDWTSEDRADALALAAHIQRCEAEAIDRAVGEHTAKGYATAKAMRRFIGREKDTQVRQRRRAVIDGLLKEPSEFEEPRRSAGGSEGCL